METLGHFTSYDKMCDVLERCHNQTAEASISAEEEGAVIYLVNKTKDPKFDRVLSLTKLKTLEYRLFRKMREKLRNTLAKNSGAPKMEDFFNLSKRFSRETKDLCQEHMDSLSMPFEFYRQILRIGYEQVSDQGAEREYFSNLLLERYVDFMEEVIKIYSAAGVKGRDKDLVFSFRSDVLPDFPCNPKENREGQAELKEEDKVDEV